MKPLLALAVVALGGCGYQHIECPDGYKQTQIGALSVINCPDDLKR